MNINDWQAGKEMIFAASSPLHAKAVNSRAH